MEEKTYEYVNNTDRVEFYPNKLLCYKNEQLILEINLKQSTYFLVRGFLPSFKVIDIYPIVPVGSRLIPRQIPITILSKDLEVFKKELGNLIPEANFGVAYNDTKLHNIGFTNENKSFLFFGTITGLLVMMVIIFIVSIALN